MKLSQTVCFLSKSPLLPVKLVPLHKISMITRFPDVDRRETYERSFDFSKSPNLQEVTLVCGVFGYTRGGLPWFPMALSTLEPTTSPRLSTIRLDFTCSSYFTGSAETLIEDMGDDPQ